MDTGPTGTPSPTTGLTGVVPPLITPLTPDGDLDTASLERLVGYLLDGGVHGLFALGSTSEVALPVGASSRSDSGPSSRCGCSANAIGSNRKSF